MSKIAIIVDKYENLKETISIIHDITQESIIKIQNAIKLRSAVFEGKLFCNDHDEVSNRLIELVKTLMKIGVNIYIYELDEDYDISCLNKHPENIISTITLLNILEKHDMEIERQKNL